MATALTARSMVSLALPQNRVMRLATQAAIAFTGTLLLTLAAKTSVPVGVTNVSLQTLALSLIAIAFGSRLALATVAFYVVEGAMGLPVFTGAGSGLAYILGPTGGYIAGFFIMAALIGAAADRGWDRNPVKLFAVVAVADALMLACGYAWLSVLIGSKAAWIGGVQPFIAPDLIKAALASTIAPAAWALLRRG